MSDTNVLNADTVFRGVVNLAGASAVYHKAGSIQNADIAAGADIETTKMKNHRHKAGCDFGLDIDDVAVSEERIVFVAENACTVQAFKAKLNGATTTGTANFDLKKNGSSILDSTVDVTSTESTAVQTGTLSSTTLVAGDVLSIALTSDDSGFDGTGPFAFVVLDEDV